MALFPIDESYAAWTAKCAAAGTHRGARVRPQYAEARTSELMDGAAPAAGGPYTWALTAEQKPINREARLTISAELGTRAGAGDAGLPGAVNAIDPLQQLHVSSRQRLCRVRGRSADSTELTVLRQCGH